MSNEDVESGLSRRDLLRILAGVAAANGLGVATWGALEALVPAESADTWHKSVCRFCGTGCGVLVAMRDGRAWPKPRAALTLCMASGLRILRERN